jgi:hypothetical protein
VSFSLITIGNVIALQTTENYSLSMDTILSGLKFGLPAGQGAVVTALATFGIIGVGATELVAYPYWCLEKGYAKSTGPRDDSPGWSERAHGWFKVMKFDAFASMIIYTIATAAFYLMGVAVLHSDGRNPEGRRMVSTLAESYVPIFGNFARWLFLGGAVAVLYSTYLSHGGRLSRSHRRHIERPGLGQPSQSRDCAVDGIAARLRGGVSVVSEASAAGADRWVRAVLYVAGAGVQCYVLSVSRNRQAVDARQGMGLVSRGVCDGTRDCRWLRYLGTDFECARKLKSLHLLRIAASAFGLYGIARPGNNSSLRTDSK